MSDESTIFQLHTVHRAGVTIGEEGNDYDLPSAPGPANRLMKTDGSGDVVFGQAALSELSDVDLTGASSGQVLRFTGSLWSPATTPSSIASRLTKTVSVPNGVGSTPLVTITLGTATVGLAWVHIVVLGHNVSDLVPVVLERVGTLRMNGSGNVTWYGGLDLYQTALAFPAPSTAGASLTQSMNRDLLLSRSAYVVVEVIPQFGNFTGLTIS